VGLEVTFLGISVVALAGIGLAYFMYVARPTVPVALARRLGPLHKLLVNKYYVDERYMTFVINPLKGLGGWLARIFDARGIDGLVNSVAYATRALASLSADVFDPKILDARCRPVPCAITPCTFSWVWLL
jgi:NADH:ubiquinone oxidoreductase subunit 5 (subunit L)/multisubunit Na+/H+ antiporter MnhA subunit